jgi:hypothetical protein
LFFGPPSSFGTQGERRDSALLFAIGELFFDFQQACGVLLQIVLHDFRRHLGDGAVEKRDGAFYRFLHTTEGVATAGQELFGK